MVPIMRYCAHRQARYDIARMSEKRTERSHAVPNVHTAEREREQRGWQYD